MRRAARKRHPDKLEWLLGSSGDGDLLYIGSVDRNPENHRKHERLQRALARHAACVLGVYGSEEQAADVRARGCEAVPARVEALDLGRSFDVIVAPDNIEHLSDAGGFLRSMRSHLSPGGSLLVTTPNPTSLVRILEQLVRGRAKANVEHTAWYTGQVLDQLARRHGLRVEEEAFIDDMRQYHRADGAGGRMGLGRRLQVRAIVLLDQIVCAVFPQLSETFGFVLRRIDD